MASSNVPKFGNWENEEDVPYTAYFEKARKVRTSGGKTTNPNEPEEETSDLYSKPDQEEPVKTSESKRQGKFVSQNNSYEKSPLHNHAAKASPLSNGNKNSYDGTGRSKPRSNHKGDESPEKAAVLPKFGDWDESNSSSADGYTNIFNQVRQERTSSSNVIGSSRTPTHSTDRNPSDQPKFCCFSWGGK